VLDKSKERFLSAQTPFGMTAQFLGPRTAGLERQVLEKHEVGLLRGFGGLGEDRDGRNDLRGGRLYVELIG